MTLRLQRDGRTLDLGGLKPLGTGGEASVYVVAGAGWAAKVYHREVASRAAKLRVMIANPPEDPTAARGHVSIAWPQDLLVDAHGRVAGYVMPLVVGMRRMIDFYHPATRRRECPLFNYHYLLITAQNLATAAKALHQRGYVMGDVNESNILVAETTMVTLVDTDSFQVREPGEVMVHRCVVGSPLYTPREMQDVDFSAVERCEEHDRFGLGVLMFQLLMEGSHPFQIRFMGVGDPPEINELIRDGRFPHATGSALWQPPPHAPPFGMLDARLRGLFTRCFVDGHHDPRARPTAEEWRENLVDSIAILISCKANPSHRYWPHSKACPWCERAKKLGGSDPFPSKAQVEAGRHLARAVKRRPAPAPLAPQSRSRPLTPPLAVTPPHSQVAQPWMQRPRALWFLGLLILGLVVALTVPKLNSAKPVPQPASRPPAEQPAVIERALPPARTTAVPLAGASAADLADAQGGTRLAADLGNGVTLELCAIPAGTFTMGGAGPDEPAHAVRLTKPFLLGRTEVTQAQWQAVAGDNPSHFKGDDLPVEQVSWDDAQEFCGMLNSMELLPAGWRFALPGEAQWEYACRAGTADDFAGSLDEMAWYSGNSGATTHAVATKMANAWGLFDMHGNVWEWCADWNGDYPSGALTDPTGPDSGSGRVFRGGSWGRDASGCRSATRIWGSPVTRSNIIGLRLAAVPSA